MQVTRCGRYSVTYPRLPFRKHSPSLMPGGTESHPFVCKSHHASERSLLYDLNYLFSWRLLRAHGWLLARNLFEWRRGPHFILAIIVFSQPLGFPKAGSTPPQQPHFISICVCSQPVTVSQGTIETSSQTEKLLFSLLICCNISQGGGEVTIVCDF